MFCIRIRARPGTKSDSEEWAGAYVNCYIDFADSRGAEVLARWYVADMGWLPECVLQMHPVDPEDAEPDIVKYIQEAQANGYCVVIHSWPAGADDAKEDDPDEWDPPREHERRLAAIAGTYADADSLLRLRTDRHFGWGRDGSVCSGTWHVARDELTLVYFPAEGRKKAVFDGPWRVLPDALAGPGTTLRREGTSA